MTEKTEFEEKEYEQPLNHQLLLSSNNLWSPGQVFEKIFGIDAAIYATNTNFWRIAGYSSVPSGTYFYNYRWWYYWRVINKTIKKFPTFKINLLIQAKRPIYNNTANIKYSTRGITGAYWQFYTTFHQQTILEKLEKKLGSDALVIYACPSFHKFDDLDNYIQNGQLVSNSTFVKPSVLSKHKKWVFDHPGTIGLACSEIKEHSDNKFEEQLEILFSHADSEKESNDKDILDNLLKLEKISLELSKELQDSNPIAKSFINRMQIISNILSNNETNENTLAIKSFMSFDIFTSLLNTTWWTI